MTLWGTDRGASWTGDSSGDSFSIVSPSNRPTPPSNAPAKICFKFPRGSPVFLPRGKCSCHLMLLIVDLRFVGEVYSFYRMSADGCNGDQLEFPAELESQDEFGVCSGHVELCSSSDTVAGYVRFHRSTVPKVGSRDASNGGVVWCQISL